MRALSIRQPYVELILRGIKKIEYRSRRTRIIGPDPDDPELQIVRISLKDVAAEVTRRIQDQS